MTGEIRKVNYVQYIKYRCGGKYIQGEEPSIKIYHEWKIKKSVLIS